MRPLVSPGEERCGPADDQSAELYIRGRQISQTMASTTTQPDEISIVRVSGRRPRTDSKVASISNESTLHRSIKPTVRGRCLPARCAPHSAHGWPLPPPNVVRCASGSTLVRCPARSRRGCVSTCGLLRQGMRRADLPTNDRGGVACTNHLKSLQVFATILGDDPSDQQSLKELEDEVSKKTDEDPGGAFEVAS